MDLHPGLEAFIVGVVDVGVPPSDVGEHHAVAASQAFEHLGGAVGVVLGVGPVVDQGVRRPVDGLALVQVEHVAVTPQAGVARPLVAREGHEPVVLGELGGQVVEMGPEGVGDLEVVALVGHHVQERPVPGEGMEVAGRVGADGLLGLAVEISPPWQQPRPCTHRSGLDPERVRRGDRRAGPRTALHQLEPHQARFFDGQVVGHHGERSRPEHHLVEQAGNRMHRPVVGHAADAERGVSPVTRVTPPVVASHREPERFPGRADRRDDETPGHRRPGHDGHLGLYRELHVVVGGDGVDEDPELEGVLAERLEANAGTPAPGVAEAQHDLVALAQVAPDHLDVQRLVPGTDVPLGVELDVQDRAVGCLDRHVVGCGRVVELGLAHVAGEPVDDLQRTGVVDAEPARRVGQRERLVGPGLEPPLRADGRRAHGVWQVGGVGHDADPPTEPTGDSDWNDRVRVGPA